MEVALIERQDERNGNKEELNYIILLLHVYTHTLIYKNISSTYIMGSYCIYLHYKNATRIKIKERKKESPPLCTRFFFFLFLFRSFYLFVN